MTPTPQRRHRLLQSLFHCLQEEEKALAGDRWDYGLRLQRKKSLLIDALAQCAAAAVPEHNELQEAIIDLARRNQEALGHRIGEQRSALQRTEIEMQRTRGVLRPYRGRNRESGTEGGQSLGQG